ncbi:MAG: histidine--tRNA ligase [Candidatus Zixiibacteriota bacterium]|nr:MAG: histidine--tRNA ligase [candidate division Zixibacteria bacterium]
MSVDKIKAIYGTRDILPAEADIWRKIATTVAKVADEYNYSFISTPIFEATELFSRGIGETSEVVTKEMYTFKDQGDRSLTLRPEGTASVVRSYIEHSMGARQGLAKVWYAGPMFRQERPQAGRFRQFYQFGFEAIGSLDPSIDAEIIAANYHIMELLGIDDKKLYVNSIGMPGERKKHKEAFSDFVAPLIGKFCADCRKRFETNPLRMFDCKQDACMALLKDAPVIFDYLSDDNRKHFDTVCDFLDHIGISYELDKKLVRGLDYYTRTAWEIKSDKLGSQDAISGGGRYDLLVEQLGGKPTPGIGFAAGIERVILAMPGKESGQDRKDLGFFVVIGNSRYKKEAFGLLTKIRKLGFPADIDYLGRSLKAQMKQADKSGFYYSFIFAEEEMTRGKVILRNMVDSRQFEIGLADILKAGNTIQLGELIGYIQ